MKICMVSSLYHPLIFGGASGVAQIEAEELFRRGHDVTVITTSSDNKFYEEKINGVKVYRTKIAKKFNKPIVLTVHTPFIEYSNHLYCALFEINEKLASYVVRNSSIIIALSSELEGYLLEKFGRKSSKFLNAVDTSFFTPPSKVNLAAEKFKVLFVGRFTYKKGVDRIVNLAKN